MQTSHFYYDYLWLKKRGGDHCREKNYICTFADNYNPVVFDVLFYTCKLRLDPEFLFPHISGYDSKLMFPIFSHPSDVE